WWGRGRVACEDGVLVVSLVVLVGLVVLGGVLILLSWVTATLPPSMLTSCPSSTAVWRQHLMGMNLCGIFVSSSTERGSTRTSSGPRSFYSVTTNPSLRWQWATSGRMPSDSAMSRPLAYAAAA